uniref:C2H2-type domain-containing protein n=1 Tax=Romanomermis culicivorax TaxID=13658 RepID=A0A915HF55_ROMCU
MPPPMTAPVVYGGSSVSVGFGSGLKKPKVRPEDIDLPTYAPPPPQSSTGALAAVSSVKSSSSDSTPSAAPNESKTATSAADEISPEDPSLAGLDDAAKKEAAAKLLISKQIKAFVAMQKMKQEREQKEKDKAQQKSEKVEEKGSSTMMYGPAVPPPPSSAVEEPTDLNNEMSKESVSDAPIATAKVENIENNTNNNADKDQHLVTNLPPPDIDSDVHKEGQQGSPTIKKVASPWRFIAMPICLCWPNARCRFACRLPDDEVDNNRVHKVAHPVAVVRNHRAIRAAVVRGQNIHLRDRPSNGVVDDRVAVTHQSHRDLVRVLGRDQDLIQAFLSIHLHIFLLRSPRRRSYNNGPPGYGRWRGGNGGRFHQDDYRWRGGWNRNGGRGWRGGRRTRGGYSTYYGDRDRERDDHWRRTSGGDRRSSRSRSPRSPAAGAPTAVLDQSQSTNFSLQEKKVEVVSSRSPSPIAVATETSKNVNGPSSVKRRSRSRTASETRSQADMSISSSSSRRTTKSPSPVIDKSKTKTSTGDEMNLNDFYDHDLLEGNEKNNRSIDEEKSITGDLMIRIIDRDDKQVDWPARLIFDTRTVPILHYSCKPSEFDNYKYADSKLGNNSKSSFTCPECGQKVDAAEKLQKHLIWHMNDPTTFNSYRCPECFTFYSSFDTLVSHVVSSHLGVKSSSADKTVKCCFCQSLVAQTKEAASEHSRQHLTRIQPFKLYRCALCGRLMENENGLWNHVKNAHPTVVGHYVCLLCENLPFGDSKSLINHLDGHIDESKEVTFICDSNHCSQIFVDKQSALNHLHDLHNLKPVDQNLDRMSNDNISQVAKAKKRSAIESACDLLAKKAFEKLINS